MKKTVILILSLCLLILPLSSCMNMPVSYKPANGTDGVSSVKIYYVENKNGYDAWKDAPDLDELATASAEVPSFRHTKLFADLKDLKFQDSILLVPIPTDPVFYVYGYILAITYEDGGYEYITPNGIQVWGEDAEDFDLSHLSCDVEEWRSFIDKYAPNFEPISSTTDESTTTADPS